MFQMTQGWNYNRITFYSSHMWSNRMSIIRPDHTKVSSHVVIVSHTPWIRKYSSSAKTIQLYFFPHNHLCVFNNTHRNSKILSLNLYWVAGLTGSCFDDKDVKSGSSMIERTESISHVQSFATHATILISFLRWVAHIHVCGFPTSLTQHVHGMLLLGMAVMQLLIKKL